MTVYGCQGLACLLIVIPRATFEPDNEAAELAGFQDRSQAVISNASLYNSTPGGTATNSQLLTGESGNIFGISKFLPIQAGDKVSMEVFGKYLSTSSSPVSIGSNLAGALLTGFGLPAGELQPGSANTLEAEFALGSIFAYNGTPDGVRAYLNYLFLDEDYTYVTGGYAPLENNVSDPDAFQHLTLEYIPDQDGYLFVYLSDETQQETEVYFDDFKVTHEVLIKDPQLEAYRYGFNGQEQDKDLNGTNTLLNYKYRMYNARIARFFAVDPIDHRYPFWTPYQFAGNMPIKFLDLEGLQPGERAFRAGLALSNKKAYELEIEFHGKMVESWGEVDPLEALHFVLDGLGFVPGIGEFADGANALIYTARGDYLNAAFSTISLAPVAGDLAAKGFKYSLKASGYSVQSFKTLKAARTWLSNARKYGFEAADIIRACGCLVGNTLVATKEGDKEIKDIEKGDLVWAYDELSGKIELKKVIETFEYERDTIYHVTVNKEVIEVTSDHPFYANSNWVRAGNLEVGDSLRLISGELKVISKIQYFLVKVQVYNFTVEDLHNYFITDSQILVHNGGPCDNLPKGFKSFGQLMQFGTQLQAGLSKAGFKDVKLYMQGSSAKGVSHKGVPFGDHSDFDVALTSESLFSRAEELGLTNLVNTGPIKSGSEAAQLLGINGLLQRMGEKYSREVNVMIFKNVDEIKIKEPLSKRIMTQSGG